MKINIAFVMLMLLVVGCSETEVKESRVDNLPFYSEATFTPQWLDADDAELESLHQISPFELVNQEGDTITEQTYAGKIYITDFFFTTCPGICPKMTDNMSILQDAFMEDSEVFLLSHSVTPEYDSVQVLKEYALNKGVDSRKWSLVTGSRDEIYKLGRSDYFVEEDLGLQKLPGEFLHTENFVLIDQNRHIRGIYNGLNKASLNQLIADVKTLKENG